MSFASCQSYYITLISGQAPGNLHPAQIKEPSNLARVRVYDLRHRFATTLMMKFLEEGKDLSNILPYMSSYMGHSSFEETAYYIHLLPDRLRTSKAIDWKKMESLIPKVLS